MIKNDRKVGDILQDTFLDLKKSNKSVQFSKKILKHEDFIYSNLKMLLKLRLN